MLNNAGVNEKSERLRARKPSLFGVS